MDNYENINDLLRAAAHKNYNEFRQIAFKMFDNAFNRNMQRVFIEELLADNIPQENSNG